MSFDTHRFRDALGCFATGVTVVTGLDAEGRPVGVTVNSFSSVSLAPPLILFSLDRVGNSATFFAPGRPFAVNVLARSQVALSERFAGNDADRFRDIGHAPAANGCPVFPGALATLAGSVGANHDGGDHIIVVGRVAEIARPAAGQPLVFFRGRYCGVDGGWDEESSSKAR